MKNIFKFMGIALIAGSLMVACGPDEEETTQYTITTEVNSAVMGTVTGGGVYDEGATCTLKAIPNEGHRFVKWQDDNTNNPRVFTVTGDATYTATFEVETGVQCTFGANTWDAQYVNGQYAASQNAMLIACGQTSATSYPIVRLMVSFDATPTAGTIVNGESNLYVDAQGGHANAGNPYVWVYEDENEFLTLNYSDGTSETAGDWWDKTMTLNITAFDATAMTVSLIANATMGKAGEVFDGTTWADCTSRDLTLTITNQSLTAAGKALFKSGIAKIAR